MKTFAAPDGTTVNFSNHRILVYGFSSDEISKIKDNIHLDDFELYTANSIEDVIALDSCIIILNIDNLTQSEYRLFAEYYGEIKDCCDESIFLIGKSKPQKIKSSKIHSFLSLPELLSVLNENLVKSKRKINKSRAFSKNLADCLMILSLIRSNPGIRTKELSQRLELPVRTVQRHISTLQATGEWIEYDTKKRGWNLQYGISILFGDHISEISEEGAKNDQCK